MKPQDLEKAQKALQALNDLLIQQSSAEWASTIDETIKAISTSNTHNPNPDQLSQLYHLREFWKTLN